MNVHYLYQKELKKLFRVIERGQKNNYRFWLRDLAIFQIGYYCGLRASEIGLLKYGYFNEPRTEIFCKRLKGSRSNTIRLDPTRTKILKKYIREFNITNPDAPLFLSRKKKPISRQTLDDLIRSYSTTAKIPADKKHFHVLKHSIAVHLAESGADLKELAEWLGHKEIKNTMIYFDYTTKQHDDFHKKIRQDYQVVV